MKNIKLLSHIHTIKTYIRNLYRRSVMEPIKDTVHLTGKEEEMVNTISERLSVQNVESLLKKICSPNGWSNSVEFATFNYNNENKISSVSIGLFNLDKGEIDLNVVEPENFIRIITNVTANQIEKHPDKERQYKEMYLNVLKFIDKNK